MDSSAPSTEKTASPSSPSPSPAAPASSNGTMAPPLRVRPPAFSKSEPSTLSMSPGPDFATGSDPVDLGASGSTRSSDEAKAVKFDKHAITEIARDLIGTASLYVHGMLARYDAEIEQELWVASDRDEKQMGDPLASIVHRHVGGGSVPVDVADALVAGVGAVAYLLRNARRAWKIRRGLRKLAAVDPLNAAGDQTGDPA